VLEEKGYKVLSFRNGAEAYAMLGRHKPEAIISDIEMPEMDGYAFKKAMMNAFPDVDIPFVYITSRKKEETDRKARSLGVNHCFFKPLKMPAFLNNLSRILDERRKVPVPVDSRLCK
jgi:CheY-like chemotaxis protein